MISTKQFLVFFFSFLTKFKQNKKENYSGKYTELSIKFLKNSITNKDKCDLCNILRASSSGKGFLDLLEYY